LVQSGPTAAHAAFPAGTGYYLLEDQLTGNGRDVRAPLRAFANAEVTAGRMPMLAEARPP
jgi:hypothetical protein